MSLGLAGSSLPKSIITNSHISGLWHFPKIVVTLTINNIDLLSNSSFVIVGAVNLGHVISSPRNRNMLTNNGYGVFYSPEAVFQNGKTKISVNIDHSFAQKSLQMQNELKCSFEYLSVRIFGSSFPRRFSEHLINLRY